MRENRFQSMVIQRIKFLMPEAIVLKTDSSYIQGFPDLLVLCNDRWAALECKRYSDSSIRVNQEWYVNRLSDMSFAAFISQNNMEDVLNALQQSFNS